MAEGVTSPPDQRGRPGPGKPPPSAVLRVATGDYIRVFNTGGQLKSQSAILDVVAKDMATTFNQVTRTARRRSRSTGGTSSRAKLSVRDMSLERPRTRPDDDVFITTEVGRSDTKPSTQRPAMSIAPSKADPVQASAAVVRRRGRASVRPVDRPLSAPSFVHLSENSARPKPIIGSASTELPPDTLPAIRGNQIGALRTRHSPATSSLEETDSSTTSHHMGSGTAPAARAATVAGYEYPRPLRLTLHRQEAPTPKYSPGSPPPRPPGHVTQPLYHSLPRTSRHVVREESSSSPDDRLRRGRLHSAPAETSLQRRSSDRETAGQPPVKGYMGSPSSSMFDDDPGIMSEAETASTGFRRGVKVRSSLPVVRTTSKTMERPLGVVFLQYRNETKRALLPNEITSLDTVKALFVRSFQHQLTMEYLDSPACKIYILDSSRDVFYDMEDIRPLSGRDIRDRSVLRIFETDQPQSAPTNGTTWDDNSYFSEPEFDGDQQNQHVHKTKGKGDAFRMPGGPYPAGARPAGTYPPRGQSDMPPASRGYHPGPGPPPKPQRAGCAGGRSGRAAAAPRPVFYPGDGYAGSPERGRGYPYPGGAAGFGDQYYPPPYRNPLVDEEARVRVESMERQLANLTGLVQKALHTPRVNRAVSDLDSGYRSDRETYHRTPSDKSVSFEKSVSFSDDHHDPPKQHSPTHAADKVPVKPAIKSSTLPRMGSQDLHLSPETYNQLRSLQKKAHDLRLEMRKLRRLSQDHATAVNEMIGDTYSKIRVCLLSSAELAFGGGETESVRVRKQEDAYSKDVLGVEKDLGEVEQHVEDLRSNVINRRRRVNMSDVESMALVLSRSSKTVAELQKRLPELQTELRGLVAQEAERVKKEERFIGEEPLRLENALRRIKKLSGTLVTLKRLASVQEQRVPDTEDAAAGAAKPADAQSKLPAGASAAGHQSAADEPHTLRAAGAAGAAGNSLDALLSELQDGGGNGGGAAAGTGAEPAPPPPPPPPRTSSRSPARSEWTRPPAPLSRAVSAPGAAPLSSTLALSDESLGRDAASSSSSSSESVSSQRPTGAAEALQRREAELRRKQAALQQQYARLQAMHGAPPRPAGEAQPAAPPLEDSDRPAAAQQQP